MALAKYDMIILAQKAITVVSINCITATGRKIPVWENPARAVSAHGAIETRTVEINRSGGCDSRVSPRKQKADTAVSLFWL